MSDIKAQLRTYLETIPEVTIDEIKLAAAPTGDLNTAMVHPHPQRSSQWKGPLIAAGTAVAIVVVVAAVVLVLRGGSVGVSDTPVTETSTTIVPAETTVAPPASTVPPIAGAGGVVTVVVSDLTDAVGNELAGVLMSYDSVSPETYKWDGVAGFTTIVDTEPFSATQTLGDVAEAWPDDPSDGQWPWPSGTATIPAGDYSLWLWTGTGYCCYSRWMPADNPGLRGCELRVSTTGQDQTIYVKDIPHDEGPCTTDAETAVTGTVTIELDALSGMEGYRILAVVWSETSDPNLDGGAFWTIVDTDPFSDNDRVHPPIFPNHDTEAGDVEGWAADDYFWDSVAQLEPGRYRIDVFANPGELKPFGSHIPASPVERSCEVTIDVTAGQNTAIVITDIPIERGPCVGAAGPIPGRPAQVGEQSILSRSMGRPTVSSRPFPSTRNP